MQSFQVTFEIRKRSFISDFSIYMTITLRLFVLIMYESIYVGFQMTAIGLESSRVTIFFKNSKM